MIRDGEDGISRSSINNETKRISVLRHSEDPVDDNNITSEDNHSQVMKTNNEREILLRRVTENTGSHPTNSTFGAEKRRRRRITLSQIGRQNIKKTSGPGRRR
jgi:hypothetical protein